MCPSHEVFLQLWGLKEEKKAWKRKKISKEDFENAVGDIEASVCIAVLVLGLMSC